MLQPCDVVSRIYCMCLPGVYSERIVSPSYLVTHRLYVHRTLKSVVVVEVDLVRSDVSEPLELNLELKRFAASYDFTFLTENSAREDVRFDIFTVHF